VNARARAHGLAAHATLAWLHGRDVPAVSLHGPVALGTEPASGRDLIEERIRLALSVPAAEMIHLGADTRHIAADRFRSLIHIAARGAATTALRFPLRPQRCHGAARQAAGTCPVTWLQSAPYGHGIRAAISSTSQPLIGQDSHLRSSVGW
jgi:hypothetical protein